MYPADFLRHAREVCDRYDVPLVLDEVFTGYGRTGPMWAADHAGIAPDILCTAKGFSGGMLPMSATLVTEKIFEAFLGGRERTFLHGHSYGGNPLGAAVAREVLRVLDEEQTLARAAPKARAIAQAFSEMQALPSVVRARSLGMIGALDLAEKTRPGDPTGYFAEIGWRVFDAARRRGLYLRPLGNVIYVAPPINIPDSDLAELLGKARESIEEALGERPVRP
jgi:adenosylmethionine-8-amino-7-oxononanoate aminotransferase